MRTSIFVLVALLALLAVGCGLVTVNGPETLTPVPAAPLAPSIDNDDNEGEAPAPPTRPITTTAPAVVTDAANVVTFEEVEEVLDRTDATTDVYETVVNEWGEYLIQFAGGENVDVTGPALVYVDVFAQGEDLPTGVSHLCEYFECFQGGWGWYMVSEDTMWEIESSLDDPHAGGYILPLNVELDGGNATFNRVAFQGYPTWVTREDVEAIISDATTTQQVVVALNEALYQSAAFWSEDDAERTFRIAGPAVAWTDLLDGELDPRVEPLCDYCVTGSWGAFWVPEGTTWTIPYPNGGGAWLPVGMESECSALNRVQLTVEGMTPQDAVQWAIDQYGLNPELVNFAERESAPDEDGLWLVWADFLGQPPRGVVPMSFGSADYGYGLFILDGEYHDGEVSAPNGGAVRICD